MQAETPPTPTLKHTRLMDRLTSGQRKLIYLGGIVLLMMASIFLAPPRPMRNRAACSPRCGSNTIWAKARWAKSIPRAPR